MTQTDTPAAQEPLGPPPGHPHPRKPEKSACDARQDEHGAISCGGCGTRWSGLSRAHCSGCHQTFASVGLFDRHRSVAGDHGTCHNPATITSTQGERLMFFRDGMWRSPEMTDEQKAEVFGRRRT